MRIGLIGLGRIGAFHADTFAGLDHVDELVVTDPVAAAVEAVTARTGKARAVADPAAVLADGVDGVVIAAATNAHAELIRAAVDAGIPTFCEKPVAGTIAESLAVEAAVAGSDVPVQIGYPRRFDPAFVAARAAVRSGALGRITTVRSTTLDPAPPPAAYLAVSGGIFRDCSVHDFDAVRWVTGQEVVEVHAVGSVDPDAAPEMYADNGDFSSVSALLTLSDGTIAWCPTPAPTAPGMTSASRCTVSATRWPPVSTRVCPCARPSRASPGRAARRTGSSWTASRRPSAWSSASSPRSRPGRSTTRAPSRTRWARRGRPRRRRCRPRSAGR